MGRSEKQIPPAARKDDKRKEHGQEIGLAHEAEVWVGAEVGEVGEDGADLGVGEAEPAGEGSGVLLDGGGGDEAAGSQIIGGVGADDWIRSVHVSAGDGTPGHDVVAAPAVVGAV